jgi:hypothetical protein
MGVTPSVGKKLPATERPVMGCGWPLPMSFTLSGPEKAK